MTVIEVYYIARELFVTTALLCLPPLLASLLVGVLISVFQAVTSVQEQTLSFVPRLAAVGLVIIVALPWSLQMTMTYAHRMLLRIAEVAQ
jgi:flagellar biosynthesis protein FliQ